MKIKYVEKWDYCCKTMQDHIKMSHIVFHSGVLLFNRHLSSGDSFEELINYCPFCGEKVEIDCDIRNDNFLLNNTKQKGE